MTTFGLHTYIPVLRDAKAKREALPVGHPHAREGARRLLNVAVATIGIILSAPVMLVIAIAIKLSSSGPVFYRQRRVGLCVRSTYGGNSRRKVDIGGRPFTILKFRTMRPSKVGEDLQVWASENDPRITAVGRFLRRTRLDELPQLFNVITGEMNIVGPRPEQPEIFRSLRDEVPGYVYRQRVRPGITGRAQVSLQYDSCVDDVRRKVEADLQYIESQSLFEDIKIMAQTPAVMLLRRGGR